MEGHCHVSIGVEDFLDDKEVAKYVNHALSQQYFILLYTLFTFVSLAHPLLSSSPYSALFFTLLTRSAANRQHGRRLVGLLRPSGARYLTW